MLIADSGIFEVWADSYAKVGRGCFVHLTCWSLGSSYLCIPLITVGSWGLYTKKRGIYGETSFFFQDGTGDI
jgi:hypothetical protein